MSWVFFAVGHACERAIEESAQPPKFLMDREMFYDETILAFGETENLGMSEKVKSSKGG